MPNHRVGPAPADVAASAASVVVLGGHPVQVTVLQPQDVLPLPAAQLARVYLGLGWREKPGAKVDLDCACISYEANGARLPNDTVWYQHLYNGAAALGKKPVSAGKKLASSIVHTGDVLTGQKPDGSQLKDQERIYVWLHAVPSTVQTIVFEANVFTGGASFSDLESAYVRLVNAETEQELARLDLAGKDALAYFGGRGVALAQLTREAAGWQLVCTTEKRDTLLKDLPTLPPSQTIAQGMPAVQPVAATVATTTPGVAESADQPKNRRKRAFPMLAVAAAGGVAAAAAIFFTTRDSPLTGSMLEPSTFMSGVDFSSLTPPDFSSLPDPAAMLSGISDAVGSLNLPMPDISAADIASSFSDAAQGGGAAAAAVAESVGGGAAVAASTIGEAAAGAGVAVSGGAAVAGSAMSEGAVVAGSAMSEGATVAGSAVVDGAAVASEGAAGAAGAVGEAAPGIFSGIANLANGVVSRASEAINSIGGGGLLDKAGDAAAAVRSNVGDVASNAYQTAGSALGNLKESMPEGGQALSAAKENFNAVAENASAVVAPVAAAAGSVVCGCIACAREVGEEGLEVAQKAVQAL